MPIYKGTTELTKIADFLTATEHDITEVYFGDQQVFTLWNEYDGTLPAQYSANGSMLADYRVYGANGGVGDRTSELYNKYGTNTNNGYIASTYLGSAGQTTPTSDTAWSVSEYIPVYSEETYTIVTGNASANLASVVEYDDGKKVVTGTAYARRSSFSITTNTQTKYLRISAYASATGSHVVEGSTAPAEYVPYGYAVDMSVQSANLFDSQTMIDSRKNIYLSNDGVETSSLGWKITYYIPCNGDDVFTLATMIGNIPAICFYDENKNFIAGRSYDNTGAISVSVGQPVYYIRFSIFINTQDISSIMLNVGSTALPYQPYSNTTTPIYIGDEPLGEDEYVDYGEQKVYRMVNGVLTPTDPPVPLPALPTVDGTNIVDYVGQSAAVPSRFYAKYRKENF